MVPGAMYNSIVLRQDAETRSSTANRNEYAVTMLSNPQSCTWELSSALLVPCPSASCRPSGRVRRSSWRRSTVVMRRPPARRPHPASARSGWASGGRAWTVMSDSVDLNFDRREPSSIEPQRSRKDAETHRTPRRAMAATHSQAGGSAAPDSLRSASDRARRGRASPAAPRIVIPAARPSIALA